MGTVCIPWPLKYLQDGCTGHTARKTWSLCFSVSGSFCIQAPAPSHPLGRFKDQNSTHGHPLLSWNFSDKETWLIVLWKPSAWLSGTQKINLPHIFINLILNLINSDIHMLLLYKKLYTYCYFYWHYSHLWLALHPVLMQVSVLETSDQDQPKLSSTINIIWVPTVTHSN